MKTIYPLLMLLFCSCYGQNKTTLTFVNKSQLVIDSIIISKPDKVVFEKLGIGQQYSKKVENIVINTNHEGTFSFTVYLRDKLLSGEWGFHDYGILGSNAEVLYIFEHGISMTEQPLEKPKDFKVFFYNASNKLIDSIINVNNSIKKVNELSPRSFEITYDFDKIQKLKDFSIIINGERKNFKIESDFDKWNYNQAFFYYENDAIKKGAMSLKEPLEFQFDLHVNLPIPSDSVKIVSPAIVKTYYFKQPKYLKVIFDFKKLKQHPIFKVNITNKEYIVDLTSHDFSNSYSHQLIYLLNEKGIKSQMY